MLYTERKNDDNTVINDITNGEGGGSIFPIITEKNRKTLKKVV